MTLPPDRKLTKEQYQAQADLLGMWYGDMGHCFSKRLMEGPARIFIDADTLEPLTSKVIAKRIREYEEYMERVHNEWLNT